MDTSQEGSGKPRLRILLANERLDRLAVLEPTVSGLGHDVVACEVDTAGVAEVTARLRPDVALVDLGADAGHALEMIDTIVAQAACPVIALIRSADPVFVEDASKRGVFAALTHREPEEWQNALDIALRRFTEHRDLLAAFARRAVIEQAKGILMERHSVSGEMAFDLLRDASRMKGHKLVEIAGAVVDGHLLLSPQPHH